MFDLQKINKVQTIQMHKVRPKAHLLHYLSLCKILFKRWILTFGDFPFAVLAEVEGKLAFDVLA